MARWRLRGLPRAAVPSVSPTKNAWSVACGLDRPQAELLGAGPLEASVGAGGHRSGWLAIAGLASHAIDARAPRLGVVA